MRSNQADAESARGERYWSPSRTVVGEGIESLTFRSRSSLVLSQIDTNRRSTFRFVEPEDMVGIGFHLRGGSHFDVEGNHFETQPLDIWAGTAPRSASSTFTLPEHGFKTVSLRFSPDSILELLAQNRHEMGRLGDLARRANERVEMARLGSLDRHTSQLVEAMLAPPYAGAARALFLESCALGLLASQIDATTRTSEHAAGSVDRSLREKVYAAREHLDSHFTEPPTIGALARIVATNEFALKRGFKQVFGQTIFGYVRQRRMQLAAAELHAGRSVQETAKEAGYTCPRSFADAFRRHFGTLPSSVLRRRASQTPDHRTRSSR